MTRSLTGSLRARLLWFLLAAIVLAAGAQALVAYRTVLHEFSGGSLIQFRHPSLGWLEFLLPSVERRRMAEHFATQESQWEHMHPPTAAP